LRKKHNQTVQYPSNRCPTTKVISMSRSYTNLVLSLHRLYTFMAKNLHKEVAPNEHFSFTMRRARIFAFYFFFLPSILIWNHIGFFLDDLFFPCWANEFVKKPMFIVGNARSGTTWLHRLITTQIDGAPKQHFLTLKTWELIFAVSVSWRLLFTALYLFDKRVLCGALLCVVLFFESMLTGNRRSANAHNFSLLDAEEDEWLMIHVALSQLITFFFPMGGDLIMPIILFDYIPSSSVPTTDVQLSAADKLAIFKYYRQCVQRHIYFHKQFGGAPENAVFVSKNPAFTLRIPTLYETFPDARVVCLLRDPVQSIPSMISYISKVCLHILFVCSLFSNSIFP
jgi:omega-hydroxy-beta-dihydromenaquinone-9 sulfotransferase